MKITAKKLKQIIMEEMDQLKEYNPFGDKMPPRELIDQIHQQLTDWQNEADPAEKQKYDELIDLINVNIPDKEDGSVPTV
jgi:hypothetical protein